MTNFAALRRKHVSYLTDDSDKNKKQNAQKSVSWSEKLHLEVIKFPRGNLTWQWTKLPRKK